MHGNVALDQTESFDWDAGNSGKSWRKHRVSDAEAEEIFFNEPLLVFPDVRHSQKEHRRYCLGQTDNARRLFLVCTVRDHKIRIISARDMSKKEKTAYEKTIQKDSAIS